MLFGCRLQEIPDWSANKCGVAASRGRLSNSRNAFGLCESNIVEIVGCANMIRDELGFTQQYMLVTAKESRFLVHLSASLWKYI